MQPRKAFLTKNDRAYSCRFGSLARARTRIGISGRSSFRRRRRFSHSRTADVGSDGDVISDRHRRQLRKIAPKNQPSGSSHLLRNRKCRPRNPPDTEQPVDVFRRLFSRLVADSGSAFDETRDDIFEENLLPSNNLKFKFVRFSY